MRKVRWSIRDDGNSTWCRHYAGEYVVFVTDCDGDRVEWEVWKRVDHEKLCKALDESPRVPDGGYDDKRSEAVRRWHPLARGEVLCGYDELEIGQAIAIEALDSILRANRAWKESRRTNATFASPEGK